MEGKRSDASTSLPDAPLPAASPRTEAPRRPASDDWFEEVTAAANVDFQYQDGNEAGHYTLLETLGGGAALFDYDADGDVDLFLAGGGGFRGDHADVVGRAGRLYRNDGRAKFADVTVETGLVDDGLYSHGAAVGDYDNDGWPDLFVAGYRGCRLYHNEQGARFRDVTEESGLRCPDWNVTAAWADYDRDGLIDLYVVTYCDYAVDVAERCPNDRHERDVCPPGRYAGARDRLFRNLGDGRFEDVTEKAGLAERNRGLSVTAADLDGDGWIDFYVGNDVQWNFLYRGGPSLPLREAAIPSGVAFSSGGEDEGTMGVDVGDFDGDGLPDLWYVNFVDEDNALCRNLGGGIFGDAAMTTGLAGKSRRWVGWGTAMADFDGDGWHDLIVTNGHVGYHRLDGPYRQPAQLFRNVEGARFVESTEAGGPWFSVPHAGRGLCVGDLDDDGALDLVMVPENEPVALLRNKKAPANWIRVTLRGKESGTDAVGAEVRCRAGGVERTQWIRGGGGYLSHFDRRLVFALPGDARQVDLSVRWPSGKRERFQTESLRTTLRIEEGAGAAE